MMAKHVHFELLCTAAVTGQITHAELTELREHAEQCELCRNRLTELAGLSARLFCATALTQRRRPLPKGMMERFIARANREGIPLNPRTAHARYSAPQLAAALLLALLFCSASIHLAFLKFSPGDSSRRDMAALTNSGRPKQSQLENLPIRPQRVGQTIRVQKLRTPGTNTHRDSTLEPRLDVTGRVSEQPQAGPFNIVAQLPSFTGFPRVFRMTSSLDPAVIFKGTRQANLAESLSFVEGRPPLLLAEYKLQAFPPWSHPSFFALASPDGRASGFQLNIEAPGAAQFANPGMNAPHFQLVQKAAH